MYSTIPTTSLTAGMLRPKACAAFLGIGISTFWRWVKEGRIPQGIRLSARATVWKGADLERFLEQAAGTPGKVGV